MHIKRGRPAALPLSLLGMFRALPSGGIIIQFSLWQQPRKPSLTQNLLNIHTSVRSMYVPLAHRIEVAVLQREVAAAPAEAIPRELEEAVGLLAHHAEQVDGACHHGRVLRLRRVGADGLVEDGAELLVDLCGSEVRS